MVLTPLVFAAAGFGLDTWLGTRPWLTLVLGALALIGKLLIEWYRYVARMEHHEEHLRANRNSARRDLKPADSPHADEREPERQTDSEPANEPDRHADKQQAAA